MNYKTTTEIDHRQPKSLFKTIKMGYIYLLTSPSGKIYVGKTKREVIERWEEHRMIGARDANVVSKKNKAILYKAIRKYGWDNFKKEILIQCPNEMLDEYETKYIYMLSSNVKGIGYNMTKGGDGGEPSQELLQKRGAAIKHAENKHLPVYIERARRNGPIVGYKVRKPGFANACFTSSDLTMDEKLQMAKDYLDGINNGSITKQPRRPHGKHSDLPKYVTYSEQKDKYIVKIPGKPSKHFGSSKEITEEKLAKALEYLKLNS